MPRHSKESILKELKNTQLHYANLVAYELNIPEDIRNQNNLETSQFWLNKVNNQITALNNLSGDFANVQEAIQFLKSH